MIKTYETVHKVRRIYHNDPMKRPPSEAALRHAADVFMQHGGTMRTGEAASAGIHYATLYWMRDQGRLERLTRGVYRLAELPAPGKYDVVAVAERVPAAVLCLVSALDFHDIGNQIPHAVEIAVGPSDRHPKLDYPPLRVYRMSGEALTSGIEEHDVDGTRVRVYSIAKTVADCFKFRNKIGYDVAIEALQEVVHEHLASPAEIMEYAQVDRVARIVRPYLEALQ